MNRVIASIAAGIVLVSSLGMGVAPIASAQEPTPVPVGATINTANKQQIIETFNGINEFRAGKGLKPVAFNATVTELAEDWADHMASHQVFLHNPSFSTDPRVSGRWTAAGEIIAARSDIQAEGLVYQWETSPSHNAVMSDPNLKTIGVGISIRYDNGRPTMYGVVNFFNFTNDPPAGQYVLAQDYFDGKQEPEPAPIQNISPTPPTFNSAEGSFTIPSFEGVAYNVNGRLRYPGKYFAPESIWVEAVAQTGYAISGTSSWYHDFTPKKTVTAAPPAFDMETANYTIPTSEGVRYIVAGKVKAAGTYNDGFTTVTVTAENLTGYVLSGTKTWTVNFNTTVTVVAQTPTSDDAAGTYTIPNVEGVQYYVNGASTHAGIYSAGGATVHITAEAKPGYKLAGVAAWSYAFSPKPPVTQPSDPAIKAAGDLVAVDSYGTLWNYGSLNSPRLKIGAGWHVMQEVHVADWNSDGIQDIVALHNSGSLHVYLGKASGGFTRITIGSGWAGFDIDLSKWKAGDQYPGIIAKQNSTGRLYYYPNLTGKSLSSRTEIGSGWGGLDLHLLDWDKDSSMDVIAKTREGQLKLYRTNGEGRFLNESRAVIGRGWHVFNSMHAIDGLKGAPTPGILARDGAGRLYYYGTKTSRWMSPSQIGSGWGNFNIAGH